MEKITDEQFQEFVSDGIDSLPSWVHSEIENVAFLIDDEPDEEKRRELGMEEGDSLFGLYEGVPRTERGVEPPLMPDTITIYKRPILATYSDPEDVRTCVINTIWHEVAHYFGHDEEWVEREERRRGKQM